MQHNLFHSITQNQKTQPLLHRAIRIVHQHQAVTLLLRAVDHHQVDLALVALVALVPMAYRKTPPLVLGIMLC